MAVLAGRSVDKLTTTEAPAIPASRKLIRNGSVTVEVSSLESALSAVRNAVQAFGGYVSDESQAQDAVRGAHASVTCRVPADRLDAMLARMKGVGRLRDVSIKTEDITERYFDLDVRLRNQKILEERLVGLLSRSGQNLGDLLSVERELARVRAEIDGLEGRRRYWDNQVAYSTLTITIEGPQAALAAREGGVWSSLKNAATESAENFVFFLAGLIAAIGWLAPLIVVLTIAAWALGRLWRFARRRRVPAKAA